MPHAHGMTPPVPRIEIADDRDPCRIGRPDREANTLHTVDAGDLCAETGRELEMPALADQMKVKLAQQKPERIRILGILNRLPPCDAQKIRPYSESWGPSTENGSPCVPFASASAVSAASRQDSASCEWVIAVSRSRAVRRASKGRQAGRRSMWAGCLPRR